MGAWPVCSFTKVQVDIRACRHMKHVGLEASSLTEVWNHFVSVAHGGGRSVHLLTRDHALCTQLTFSASTHHPLHSACFQARVTYFCACLNLCGARAWAKYALSWRVHDQCAVGARCSWIFGPYMKDTSGSKLSFLGMVTLLVYSDQHSVPSITITVWHWGWNHRRLVRSTSMQ